MLNMFDDEVLWTEHAQVVPPLHHIIVALCTETPGLCTITAQYAPEQAALGGSQAVFSTHNV